MGQGTRYLPTDGARDASVERIAQANRRLQGIPDFATLHPGYIGRVAWMERSEIRDQYSNRSSRLELHEKRNASWNPKTGYIGHTAVRAISLTMRSR